MRRSLLAFLLLASPLILHAQAGNAGCDVAMQQAIPLRPTAVAPLAIELAPASTQLGNSASVLGQVFDEALSIDSVLLRIKLTGCLTASITKPASIAAMSDDPAAYKPKTEFDNTPWRFDMSQNGKRMTADEFDAWMKARGLRVVGGKFLRIPAETAAPPIEAAKN